MTQCAAQPPTRNSIWADDDGEVRVMAVVEGYVVARRKGAVPFLLPQREFVSAFRPVSS